MWHAWIQNRELHVLLMYMFAIKPPMAQKWCIFCKMWGVCSNTCSRCFKSMQKVRSWKQGWR